MNNTRIDYLYRDADNYKRDNTCVVPELSPRSRKQSSLPALTMANQGCLLYTSDAADE